MAANQPPANYWIRAQPNSGNTSFVGGLNSAILRYAGAPSVEPTTTYNALKQTLVEQNLHVCRSELPHIVHVLNVHDLQPLTDAAAPGAPYPGGTMLTTFLPSFLPCLRELSARSGADLTMELDVGFVRSFRSMPPSFTHRVLGFHRFIRNQRPFLPVPDGTCATSSAQWR